MQLSKSERRIREILQHYPEKKYWKMRDYVIDRQKKNLILKYYYLYRIKKMDAFNNASMGTHINFGAKFLEVPSFPHGLYGIIISHNTVIGKNCTIFHDVTIGEAENGDVGGVTQIGDGVMIGCGAKIIGRVKIGNNCRIGAGCVVTEDVPDNATVVLQKPRMIVKG